MSMITPFQCHLFKHNLVHIVPFTLFYRYDEFIPLFEYVEIMRNGALLREVYKYYSLLT